jgi:hypothetical protein
VSTGDDRPLRVCGHSLKTYLDCGSKVKVFYSRFYFEAMK